MIRNRPVQLFTAIIVLLLSVTISLQAETYSEDPATYCSDLPSSNFPDCQAGIANVSASGCYVDVTYNPTTSDDDVGWSIDKTTNNCSKEPVENEFSVSFKYDVGTHWDVEGSVDAKWKNIIGGEIGGSIGGKYGKDTTKSMDFEEKIKITVPPCSVEHIVIKLVRKIINFSVTLTAHCTYDYPNSKEHKLVNKDFTSPIGTIKGRDFRSTSYEEKDDIHPRPVTKDDCDKCDECMLKGS